MTTATAAPLLACDRHPDSVILGLDDLHTALDEAWERQVAAVDRGSPETSVYVRGIDNHWHGVVGEMAWENLLEVPHSRDVVYTGKRPDTGGFEARYRTGRDYELYVKDTDPDDRRMILLIGHLLPRVCIAGVLTAGQARQIGQRKPWLGPHLYVAQGALVRWRPEFARFAR